MDTHPGTITHVSLRRRHSWILRDAIYVGSETEKKNSMTHDAASPRLQMWWNQTH